MNLDVNSKGMHLKSKGMKQIILWYILRTGLESRDIMKQAEIVIQQRVRKAVPSNMDIVLWSGLLCC